MKIAKEDKLAPIHKYLEQIAHELIRNIMEMISAGNA